MSWLGEGDLPEEFRHRIDKARADWMKGYGGLGSTPTRAIGGIFGLPNAITTALGPDTGGPKWSTPSMSIEEIEADPFTLDVGKRMREKGMTRVTRSEYLELFYGTKKPRPWTPEMEEEMPNKLVDPYVKFTG